MQERVPQKPVLPPDIAWDLCYAACACDCLAGAGSAPAETPRWARSAGLPNGEAVALPVTMFNDRPFGPAFVPQ